MKLKTLIAFGLTTSILAQTFAQEPEKRSNSEPLCSVGKSLGVIRQAFILVPAVLYPQATQIA